MVVSDPDREYEEDLKDWAGSWVEDVQKLIKEKPELTEMALCWLYCKGARQGWKAADLHHTETLAESIDK